MTIPAIGTTTPVSSQIAPDGDPAAVEARETAAAKRAEAQGAGHTPASPDPAQLSGVLNTIA